MNNLTPLPSDMDRRAAALADVRQMSEDLHNAHAEIEQLKADLNQERDRCVMLVEDRNRHRHDALIYRAKLIELATSMANIGLLTVTAQELVRVAQELTSNGTPTTSAIDKLEQSYVAGSRKAETHAQD